MKVSQLMKRNLGALVLLLVVGYSLFYAVAFVRLYSVEHPYDISSRWIFENVPAGSKIVAPHWDDKVPRSVPNAPRSPAIYHMEGRDFELGVYEQDNPQNIQILLRKISASDYVTFATPRAADSIPRIHKEYPRTSALIQLLWAEKLGFVLEKSFKNRPSLLGVTFNDDLADESFSVYDHPKVVIFKNVEHLPSEELALRIHKAVDFGPLPSMNEILLMDQGGWQPSKRWWNPEWNVYIHATGTVLVLGVITLVLFGHTLTRLPDGGFGLAMIVGVVSLYVICWLAARLQVLPFTDNAARAIVVCAAIFALARFSLRAGLRRTLRAKLATHGVWVLVAFLGGALAMAVMRWSDPGFFKLEEGAQAAYLQYCMRVDSLPLLDIFNPGQRLPIDVIGTCIVSWVLRVAAVPSALALKSVFLVQGAVFGALMYSILALFARVPVRACLAAILLVVPIAYVEKALEESLRSPLLASSVSNSRGDFVKWADTHISATPVVLEACDGQALQGTSALAGLPTFVEPVDSATMGAQPSLCSGTDPEAVFKGMMKYEVPLFVTQGVRSAQAPAVKARLTNFNARPDLFSKLYDDGVIVVYAPASSPYFGPPRAS